MSQNWLQKSLIRMLQAGVGDNGNIPTYSESSQQFVLSTTISGTVLHRSDTDANLAAIVAGAGEIMVPTDRRYVRIGDGVTAGGRIAGPFMVFSQTVAGSLSVGTVAPTEETISRDAAGSIGAWTIPAGTFQQTGDVLIVEMVIQLKANNHGKAIGLYVANGTPAADTTLGLDCWNGTGDASTPSILNTNTNAPVNINTRIRFKRSSSSGFQVSFLNSVSNSTTVVPMVTGSTGTVSVTGLDFTQAINMLLTGTTTVGTALDVSLRNAEGIFFPFK